MTTEPEHTDRPSLTSPSRCPLPTPERWATVGQMAMRLGAVLHGLAQLRAGGAGTEDLATTVLMPTG